MTVRRVALVAREMDGIAGAGGLKDAVRGLADALVGEGIDTTVILPRYGFVERPPAAREISIRIAGRTRAVQVGSRSFRGMRILLIEDEAFASKRDVYVYVAEDAPTPQETGKGHRDVHLMNAIHQSAAIKALVAEGISADVVHGHDGHCGLLPLYMKLHDPAGTVLAHTASLTTIHNAGVAYQQIIGPPDQAAALTGLPECCLASGLQHGLVNPLLIAGRFGALNTVSPGYARELLTRPVPHTGGLAETWRREGVRIPGICNGLDPALWQKEGQSSPGTPEGKLRRRRAVVENLRCRRSASVEVVGGLPSEDRFWIIFHGRLTEQKGIDRVLALDNLPKETVQLIIYGRGDGVIENRVAAKCAAAENWSFIRGYNEPLTSDLVSASSYILVPSLWEPCGQIDMAGQLLGALPIVRGVGGLKKIRNGRDGFRYRPEDEGGLAGMVDRAIRMETTQPRKMARMRRRAENTVYGRRSWRKVLAQGYLPLYKALLRRSRPHR